MVLADGLQGLPPICYGTDPQAGALQQQARRLPHVRLVLYDRDRLIHHPAPPIWARASSTQNRRSRAGAHEGPYAGRTEWRAGTSGPSRTRSCSRRTSSMSSSAVTNTDWNGLEFLFEQGSGRGHSRQWRTELVRDAGVNRRSRSATRKSSAISSLERLSHAVERIGPNPKLVVGPRLEAIEQSFGEGTGGFAPSRTGRSLRLATWLPNSAAARMATTQPAPSPFRASFTLSAVAACEKEKYSPVDSAGHTGHHKE